ncbi:SPOR domain-containing protein [Hirschia maritima]|uniref:SPOR domain-containing protein n=1 Tax=Hirschia maritima TaxID=1121961 RepID=UPI00036CFFC9|nr:SPOR domain-containing protein [Hirschia maritima]
MTDRKTNQAEKKQMAYAVLPDENGGYEIPDDNNRGPLVLAMALGVIAVFGVVVWNAYKQGVRHSDSSALPQIASEGAFKVRPVDPGGRADENTNIRVLDQVGGTSRTEFEATDINVREEPVPVLEKVAIEANQSGGLASKSVQPAVKRQVQNRKLGENGKPVDLRPGAKPASSSVVTQEIKPRPVIKKPPVQSAELNVTPIQKPKPRSVTPKSSENTPKFSSAGRFVVQLAAVKTTDAVDSVWKNAGKKAPNLFQNAKRHVQTVDLGPKGVWHRIQAGSFDSRADANVFCKAYKASGGDCIVAEKK